MKGCFFMNLKKITATYIALIIALVFTNKPVFAESRNWGLSYPTPGTTPVGNASQEYLKEFDSYFVGSPDEKVLYLTFDAGYDNGCTEKILDTLKKTDVPAAFFLVGTFIRDYPELTKRIASEGHIVANHTMKHPDMSAISDKAAFQNELQKAEELYKNLIGSDMPKYYRPPQGVFSESNLKMANEMGYKTIFWSIAYADWSEKNQPSKEMAFSKLMSRLHPGAIILLHSTSRTNTDILEEFIYKCREMGYEFKSLDYL